MSNFRNTILSMSSKDLVKTVVTTGIGGILLLFATVFLNAFLSSPPTRAEFDSMKAQSRERQISIDRRLNNLENGQKEIKQLILKPIRR